MHLNFKRIYNFVIFLSLGYFLYLNIKGAFQQTSFHYLHIDERQVIESALNVFQLNDEFNRFDSVSNSFLRNSLIVLAEIVVGGNLDFGRLYKNIFVFFAGPFYIFNTTAVILVERLIQITFFMHQFFIFLFTL